MTTATLLRFLYLLNFFLMDYWFSEKKMFFKHLDHFFTDKSFSKQNPIEEAFQWYTDSLKKVLFKKELEDLSCRPSKTENILFE